MSQTQSKAGSIASRLYRGEVSFDFIGRRRKWYALSAAVIGISLASLLFRGFHAGIEFKGGAVFEAPLGGRSLADARGILNDVGVTPIVAQRVGEGRVRLQTGALADTKTTEVQRALATQLRVGVDDVAVSTVGPTWGRQITTKAVQGLLIFLVLLFVLLSVRFEPKMAIAAFIALIHDIVITAGIYSLIGFEVTPATVIALLTILGFSLYDTVVVFDKVRENTMGLAGGSRMTYSAAANLALNQTLVRSLNTSIIALLPVGSLLFIGAGLLKAGTLKDLALALFIGLASGAYSSIFTATPLLCDLKEREPQFQALARRVEGRRGGRVPAAAGVGAVGARGAGRGGRGAGSGLGAGARVGSGSGTGAGSVLLEPGDEGDEGVEEPALPAAAPAPRQQRAPQRKAAPRSRSGRPSGKRRR